MWPPLVSDHQSKRPKVFQSKPYSWYQSRKLTPLVSDRDHFWGDGLIILYFQAPVGERLTHDLLSVFTVCTKQLRVWEEILETTWIYLCWNLEIACNIIILYIFSLKHICVRASPHERSSAVWLSLLATCKRPLTLHSLGDCPQKVRLH